jgi:hypothetical protein
MAIDKKKLGIIVLVLGAAALIYMLFSKSATATQQAITGLPINSAGGGGSAILAPISAPAGGTPPPANSGTNTTPTQTSAPGLLATVPAPPPTGYLATYNVFTSDPSATVGLASIQNGQYVCAIGTPAMANETGQVNCVNQADGSVDWTG